MFGIGTTEILIILAVALLVIGPSKLPEVAKALGKGMAEFKKMSSDVKRTIDMETHLAEMEDEEKNKDRSATEGPADDPAAEFSTDPPSSETDMAESEGMEEAPSMSPETTRTVAGESESPDREFGVQDEPDAELKSAGREPTPEERAGHQDQDVPGGKRDA